MKLVDTHFHLDLQKDPPATAAQCESQGIYTIAVTNAPSVFEYTRRLAASTTHVRAAAGLHPELIASHAHELPTLISLLNQTRYVGEIGLDYVTSDKELRKKQRMIFEAILYRSAEIGDKILSIHSRRAASDVTACIGGAFRGTIILHWFSGTKRELQKAVDAGCFFSVNPSMAQSERGRALILDIPQTQILTETDGPFVKVEGRPAVPSDVKFAVDSLARLWNVEPDEAAAIVFNNFRTILNSPHQLIYS